MADSAFSSLLADLWRDLQHPDLIWQSLLLLACLVAAKLTERVVRGQHVEESSRALRMGHGGLKRIAFPLVAMLLVALSRGILAPHMHVHLLTLALPLLASLAMIRCVFYVLRLTFSAAAWLVSFERIFAMLVWGVVALHIAGVLPEVIKAMEAVHFTLGKQKLNLWLLLQGLFAVGVSLLVSLWLGSLIEHRLMRNTAIEANLQVVFSRLVKAALVLLAVMLSLPSVGIDLTALSVFGGAIGVGLGFGLQKIASNYVAGFIILLERSIRLGNVISVGNDKGQVMQITTRYTVLRNGSGVESLVPNEALVSSTVQNETYSDYRVRHNLAVQINYRHDPQHAMQLMVAAATNHPNVSSSSAPQAFIDAFADFGIALQLQFWLDSQEINAQRVRSDLYLAILQSFSAAGIEIASPHQEVRVLR